MYVVKDLLDKAVVDRNGTPMGRIDGIVLDDGADRPMRLKAILIGPAALGYRVWPLLGRVIAALEDALGLGEGRPVEIAFGHVIEIEPHVKIDLVVSDTAAEAVEHQLRRLLRKLPAWL